MLNCAHVFMRASVCALKAMQFCCFVCWQVFIFHSRYKLQVQLIAGNKHAAHSRGKHRRRLIAFEVLLLQVRNKNVATKVNIATNWFSARSRSRLSAVSYVVTAYTLERKIPYITICVLLLI